MASSSNSSGGIGFAGLLTIVFITLKLTGFITWSWLWVLCPLWIGLAIVLAFIAVAMVTLAVSFVIALCIDYASKKKGRAHD